MASVLQRRLYALQQRVALTTPEASFLLVVAFLLTAGLVVQHVRARQEPPLAPSAAAFDAEVARRAAVPAAEALAAAGQAPEADGTSAAESDSESAEVVAPPAPRPPREAASRLGPVRVNVNTAPPRQLERLPGIGPALAARIVEYRETHGPFQRPEDLVAVRGIGPKTFEKMAPYVTVE